VLVVLVVDSGVVIVGEAACSSGDNVTVAFLGDDRRRKFAVPSGDTPSVRCRLISRTSLTPLIARTFHRLSSSRFSRC